MCRVNHLHYNMIVLILQQAMNISRLVDKLALGLFITSVMAVVPSSEVY